MEYNEIKTRCMFNYFIIDPSIKYNIEINDKLFIILCIKYFTNFIALLKKIKTN